MAKITLTIEDKGEGMFSCTAEPNFEAMMKKHLAGEKFTIAETAAMFCMNRLREEFKKDKSNIIVPGKR